MVLDLAKGQILLNIRWSTRNSNNFNIKGTGCPTRYRTRLAGGPLLRVATIRRTTDTFLFISHTKNVLLFKFRCNIFIGVRIIKEMPGSVASGTHCSKGKDHPRTDHEGPEGEQRYSSTLSLASALDGGGW